MPINAAPVYQFCGEGETSLTLPGVIYPGRIGSAAALESAAAGAGAGEQYTLSDSSGGVHSAQGVWVIEHIEDTQSHFFADGKAQKIEFSISLRLIERRPDTLHAGDGYAPDLFVGVA